MAACSEHSHRLFCVCRKLTSSKAEDAGRARTPIRQVMMLSHPPLRAEEIARYLANRFPSLVYKKTVIFFFS